MSKKSSGKYRKVYGLLVRTYGRERHVQLSFGLALLSRFCKYVALPIAASQLIASLAAGSYDRARLMVLIFAAFSAIIAIFSPLTRYIALLGENYVYSRLMQNYFWSLLNKDMKYFNETMTGYLTAATRHYSDTTIQLIRKLRENYLSTIFSLIVPIIIITFVDTLLGLVVLSLSLVQAAYLIWASKKIAPYRTKSRDMYKKVSGLISDAITNIVAVKATAQEHAVAERVSENMRLETRLFMDRYRVTAKLIALREAITVTFFVSLFWLTVGRISNGRIDVAGAVLVITYSFTILAAIYELSDALDEHDDFIDRILPAFELLEEANHIKDPTNPAELTRVAGHIDIQAVSFAYTEGKSELPVFKKLTLEIPAGQKLGIVGLSGAGKSTLAKLLLRFEEPQDGRISLDGIDIAELRQADLRRHIAYVPQEPLLFHSSVADNIRLARLDADDHAIGRAVDAAHARQFIEALPQKLDSIVGERGVKLSGGQKQRIAIARAVLQDAPVIILDEATSALDSESEQIIKDSFATIFKNKTAIVIAHRLSTLADMDRVILLHDGAILEDGSHTQLLNEKGIYAKLWHRQRLHPEDLETTDRNLKKL